MIIKEVKLWKWKSRQGLSEKVAKRYFQKKGYCVYRGSLLTSRWNAKRYPNVKKAYDKIHMMIFSKLGLSYYNLMSNLTNGLPDFIVMSKNDLIFVEVKLEQESLKSNQKVCLKILEDFGFDVIVLRVKERPYRMVVKSEKDGKKVLVKQEKIWKKYGETKTLNK